MAFSKSQNGPISMAQFAHEAAHNGTLQVFALESLDKDKRVTYFVAKSRESLLNMIIRDGLSVEMSTLREINSQHMGLEADAEEAIKFAIDDMSFDPDTEVVPAFTSAAMSFSKAA